jgi:hypothetical protein
MPVSLATSWHKVKPRPKDETVTEALKKYLAVSAEVKGKVTRENLAKLASALKQLQAAAAQTRAKCDKSLHAACIKALDEADDEIQKAYDHCQLAQTKIRDDLAEFQKGRDLTAQALTIVSNAKDLAKASKARLAIQLFLKHIDQQRYLPSGELTSGLKALQEALSLLKEIEKTDAMFHELGEIAKKVGALGGYLPVPAAADKL